MTSVIAHRGASAARPENTVEAFAEAVRLGAAAIELDVRRSADDRLVVSHDASYRDGRPVRGTAFADRPDGVCGLAEALDACGPLVVNVEIKSLAAGPGEQPDPDVADAVAGMLVERGEPERFLVSSFDMSALDRVRELAPELPTAFLFLAGTEPLRAVRATARRGHAAVHPHDHLVDGSFVAAAHDAGLAVNVWTVDDPARIRRLAALGVDGVVTNVPDVALRALAR